MLQVFLGTDREKARVAMNAARGDGSVVRISDVSSMDDFHAALQGVGMFAPLEASPLTGFGSARAVALEGVSGNAEMFDVLMSNLPHLPRPANNFSS